MTDAPNTTSDNMANALFDALTSDLDLSITEPDYSSLDFTFPSSTGNPLYDAVDTLDEADLTSRTVGGSGLFDGLMVSMRAHLQEEHEAGRLTGKDYSNAYVSSTQAALGAAIQYLLGKDNAYWTAAVAQQQAKAGEVAIIRARLDAEAAKAQAKAAHVSLSTISADYALKKMGLATEEARHDLNVVQVSQGEYELANMLPAQLGKIQAEVSSLDYNTDYIMPKELARIQSQIDVGSAEISQKTAATDQTLYETSALLPSQKLNVDAEKAIKDFQLATFMPAQVAGHTADTVGKTFNNDYILPEQLNNLREQVEAARAKTLDTRTDGVTAIAGSIGKQKDLQSQQIDSYKHDAEQKVAKMLLDTWITQKSMDEGLTPPESITDTNINTVMTTIRTNLDLD